MARTETVEATPGCKACDNTGLDGTSLEARLCGDCNGSPYGFASETQVEELGEEVEDLKEEVKKDEKKSKRGSK